MKIQNLDNLMVSASEVKKELPEIMTKQMTKVIVKNNTPVSVIMPYTEYIAMNEGRLEEQKQLSEIGEDMTLVNGVQVKIVAEQGSSFSADDLVIKLYVKMKSSGDYKLHFTYNMCPPSREQTLTIEELTKYYSGELLMF